jgi:hypothetical protein
MRNADFVLRIDDVKTAYLDPETLSCPYSLRVREPVKLTEETI